MRHWPNSERATLQYKSEIAGVNTTVANMEAQLQLARYYLDNTTLTAPEDGYIINLQVRPGMVAGTFRVGGIAALIADADRYLLATYFQENLKYVKSGQSVDFKDITSGTHSIASSMSEFIKNKTDDSVVIDLSRFTWLVYNLVADEASVASKDCNLLRKLPNCI